MPLLTIQTAGPEKRARRLLIQDDPEPIITSAAVVRLLGIEDGQDICREDLERRIWELEPEQAKERAYRLIGYRERSEAELRQKLIDDGYRRPVVEATLDRLRELDFVNDSRFAYQWASSRARSGRGRTLILRELEGKGIDPETRLDVVDRVLGEYPEVDRACALIERMDLGDSKQRNRALSRLVRRGFPFEVALRAIELTAAEEPR